MLNDINIKPASLEHREAIISLLQSAGLPVEDLPNGLQNFYTAMDYGIVVGLIGLETYGRNGLLRSLVVRPDYRQMKIAAALVDEVERTGRDLRLADIYLLTETAKDYFTKKRWDYFIEHLLGEKPIRHYQLQTGN